MTAVPNELSLGLIRCTAMTPGPRAGLLGPLPGDLPGVTDTLACAVIVNPQNVLRSYPHLRTTKMKRGSHTPKRVFA